MLLYLPLSKAKGVAFRYNAHCCTCFIRDVCTVYVRYYIEIAC